MASCREQKHFDRDKLIVGCGQHHEHYFTLSESKPLLSKELHPATEFYTINNNSEAGTAHTMPDMVADFCDSNILPHFQTKKFSFICFERIMGIFADIDLAKKALTHATKLLKKEGVCVIYAGGRKISPTFLKELTAFFPFNRLIQYGEFENWTLVSSNSKKAIQAFDALTMDNAYYKIIFQKMKESGVMKVTALDREPFSLKNLFFSTGSSEAKEEKIELLDIEQDQYYLMDEDGKLPVAGYSK